MNINQYKFIARIALEYRLSLKNVCKILNLPPTDENKNLVYSMILNTASNKGEIQVFEYLFNTETSTENEKMSNKSLRRALIFLNMYVDAKKSNDKDKLDKVLKDLNKTDIEFKKVSESSLDKPMTEEDAIAIAKYRIKYCISRTGMTKFLGFGTRRLKENEDKIQDDYIKEKLEKLLEYHENITKSTYKKTAM